METRKIIDKHVEKSQKNRSCTNVNIHFHQLNNTFPPSGGAI